jgi:hypothetical protein
MTLEEMIAEAIPRKFVKFHKGVPNGENKEPVEEFRLTAKTVHDAKYIVKSIFYHKDGVIINKTDIVPLANVVFTR